MPLPFELEAVELVFEAQDSTRIGALNASRNAIARDVYLPAEAAGK
jgi:hypothetical protein